MYQKELLDHELRPFVCGDGWLRHRNALYKRLCKPLVGSSMLSPGTNKIMHFLNFWPPRAPALFFKLITQPVIRPTTAAGSGEPGRAVCTGGL